MWRLWFSASNYMHSAMVPNILQVCFPRGPTRYHKVNFVAICQFNQLPKSLSSVNIPNWVEMCWLWCGPCGRSTLYPTKYEQVVFSMYLFQLHWHFIYPYDSIAHIIQGYFSDTDCSCADCPTINELTLKVMGKIYRYQTLAKYKAWVVFLHCSPLLSLTNWDWMENGRNLAQGILSYGAYKQGSELS